MTVNGKTQENRDTANAPTYAAGEAKQQGIKGKKSARLSVY